MLQQRKYQQRKYPPGQSGDDIIQDGEGVRVPLMLMDAAVRSPIYLSDGSPAPAPVLHKPGFAQVRIGDAQIDVRERALAARSRRLRDAWKPGSPMASTDDDDMYEIASRIAPMLGLAPPKRNAARMDADPDADPGAVDPRQSRPSRP
jgi:hypothetical protein